MVEEGKAGWAFYGDRGRTLLELKFYEAVKYAAFATHEKETKLAFISSHNFL